MCVYFRDLNQAYLGGNHTTPFIDQIIDDYVGSEIFSFMNGTPTIIKFKSNQKINTRQLLYSLGNFHL